MFENRNTLSDSIPYHTIRYHIMLSFVLFFSELLYQVLEYGDTKRHPIPAFPMTTHLIPSYAISHQSTPNRTIPYRAIAVTHDAILYHIFPRHSILF